MSRLVLDSINFEALAATRWPHLVGYVNGRISAWTPEQIQAVRAEGHLLALVDVLGNAPREASILDFERGDVQSPAVVHAWARARNQFAGDATVYCAPRDIATVVSGLRGERCNLWVVDLTEDGEPPFTVPHYPGIPDNVHVIARQFVFGPRSGGNYDMSIWYRDDWHPEQLAPHHLFAARAAAAAELGPYQNASSAAEITNPDTGQIAPHRLPGVATPSGAPDALHVMTLPEPFGATLPCPSCPNAVTCAKLGECLHPDSGEAAAASSGTAAPVDQAAAAVDQAADELAGAALVASTAPAAPRIPAYVAGSGSSMAPSVDQPAARKADWPRTLITTDEAADNVVDQAAAAAAPACGNTPGGMGWPVCSLPPHGPDVDHESADFQWPPGATTPVHKQTGEVPAWPDSKAGPGTAGSVATAAAVDRPGPAQPILNHDFIRRTLSDLEEVVTMFRRAGRGSVANELERALYLAWEIGSALKSAGL